MSVRSPGEVSAALEGGADIVDAKDPARGPLGALDPGIVARVLEQVPAAVPFSVALGDPPNADSVANLVAALPMPRRDGPTFLKLGFGGADGLAMADAMLRAAVTAAARHAARPGVIAVVYADAPGAVGLSDAPAAARRAGAVGVLLDTARKNGGALTDAVPLPRLHAWTTEAQQVGLLVALAGCLDQRSLPAVGRIGPDVIGVRGAACDGGRDGRVNAAKVRGLRDLLSGMAEARGRVAKHQSGVDAARPVSARN